MQFSVPAKPLVVQHILNAAAFSTPITSRVSQWVKFIYTTGKDPLTFLHSYDSNFYNSTHYLGFCTDNTSLSDFTTQGVLLI